jgi:hypothetical protein
MGESFYRSWQNEGREFLQSKPDADLDRRPEKWIGSVHLPYLICICVTCTSCKTVFTISTIGINLGSGTILAVKFIPVVLSLSWCSL